MLKGKKGFTLIELVVVIAILGILAGIAIPRFMDATATARGARVEADLRAIDSASAMYYAQQGQHPTNIASLVTASLLAATPVAPVGDAKFANGVTANLTGTTGAYGMGPATGTGTTVGRALIGASTVEDLVNKK